MPKKKPKWLPISMSLHADDVKKLDALAGPRGRSKYLRACIEADWLNREQQASVDAHNAMVRGAAPVPHKSGASFGGIQQPPADGFEALRRMIDNPRYPLEHIVRGIAALKSSRRKYHWVGINGRAWNVLRKQALRTYEEVLERRTAAQPPKGKTK
jgi:hypothetical protein